jgi:hypothetical protein
MGNRRKYVGLSWIGEKSLKMASLSLNVGKSGTNEAWAILSGTLCKDPLTPTSLLL